MTTNTRPCVNCTTPAPDSCGCGTAHSSTALTASATAPAQRPTTATNPFLCNCELADPNAMSMLTLTAAALSVADADGPYPNGMPVGVGELLLDGPEGSAFAQTYRATMTRHAVDCPTYEVMAAVARGVLPAAQHRALRRYGPIGDAVSASRSDVLVAAALAPLGKMLEIAEPPTEPGPPDDPHMVMDLPRPDDMVPSLLRGAATSYGARDWLSLMRSANSLASLARDKAIATGQLLDDGPITAAGAAPGHDKMLTAMTSGLAWANERGDVLTAASIAAQILDRVDDNAVTYVASGIAQAERAANTKTPATPPPTTLSLAGLDPRTRVALHAIVASAQAGDDISAARSVRDLHRVLRDACAVGKAFDQLAAQNGFAQRQAKRAKPNG